jgi:hypothetical protein
VLTGNTATTFSNSQHNRFRIDSDDLVACIADWFIAGDVLLAEDVRVEFQFRRQLGSEISRGSVAASDMTQGLRLAVRVRHCVQPA